MRDFLVKEWDLQYVHSLITLMVELKFIRGLKVVLHDRPPRRFHQSTPQEIHDVPRLCYFAISF
jgi:beta-1,4-mannosyltransferase